MLGISEPEYARERVDLLSRFIRTQANAITDAELLEVFLQATSATPAARLLALRLLEIFGSLQQIIHAEEHALGAVEGVTLAVVNKLALLRLVLLRATRPALEERSILQSWDAMMDYLRVSAGTRPIEEFRVLFLNHSHRLLAEEVMWTGTVNHTPAYPREIAKRGLELGAGAIVLVHNHPTGDITPSLADITLTTRIINALGPLGIAVHDHVIVAGDGAYSFRGHGLLGSPSSSADPGAASPQLNLF